MEAVAPMLLRQNTFTDESVSGQRSGGVSVSKLHAVEQSSGTGKAQVGVMFVQGGSGLQGVQVIDALHPAEVTEKSDVKTKVRQPCRAVIVPGEAVPV